MNNSSIYADLKKFAGKIEGKKVSAMIDMEIEEYTSDSESEKVKTVLKKRVKAPSKSGAIGSHVGNHTSARVGNHTSERVNNHDSTSPDATFNSYFSTVGNTITNTSIDTSVDAATSIATATNTSVDVQTMVAEIAAMLLPPLTPLRDASGFVHDSSTIAVRCEHGHIHKVFFKDIMNNSSGIKCLTCSTGSKFMVMVRETIEATLGVPFILSEKRLDPEANSIEFNNPVLKISVACIRVSGKDVSEQRGDSTLIKIHTTASAKKVKESLYEHLVPLIESFPEEVRVRIKGLKPEVETPLRRRRAFPREPVPYTPLLAAVNIANSKANPIIAQMQLNIVTDNIDKLCLENC